MFAPASARNALTAATSPGRSPQRNNNRPTSFTGSAPWPSPGYSPPTAAIALACLDAIHDQVPYEVWMFLGDPVRAVDDLESVGAGDVSPAQLGAPAAERDVIGAPHVCGW